MANEIQIPLTINNATIVAVIRNASAQVYNTNTNSFETWTDGNIAYYAAVSLTEEGTSGYYVGNFPIAITTPGDYGIIAYHVAGANLSLSDVDVAYGSVSWDGSNESDSPSGNDLVSLSYVKEMLGITNSNSDTVLSTLITAMSQAILTWCHRDTFNVTTYTEYLDGQESLMLQLPRTPLVSVASVTLNPYGTEPTTVISGTTNGVQNLILDLKRSWIRINPSADQLFTYFPRGFQNVVVTYTAGYSSLPSDLTQVACEVVRQQYAQLGTKLLAQQERIGDYQVVYANAQRIIDANIGVTQILSAYKLWA